MSIARPTFSEFLTTQRDRRGTSGYVVRQLLAQNRRFSPDSANDWMLTGPVQFFDDEYEALAELVAQFKREKVVV